MLDDWPVWAAFLALFVIAVLRGGAIYAIGRGLRAADAHARRGGLLGGPTVARAEQLVARYGAPVVALSFLTIGIQSAINAAAGMLRMPLPRYIPALAVGGLLWASVYTTIGMAAVTALWGTGSLRWVLAGLGVVALVVGATALARGRRPRTAPRGDGRQVDDPHP